MDNSFKITDHIKKDKWREFIRNHPNGNVFQTTEMMEVYKRTKKCEPIFLAVVDESDNIKAMLFAHVIKEFEGFLGKLSTRSIIFGGPLYEENEEGINALKILVEHYDKIASKKALYTEIRNRWDASRISNVLSGMGYVYEDELNFLIDLTKSKEELWACLSQARRRGIRKAQKSGVTVKEAKDMEDVREFYDILCETYRNIKIPLVDISLFDTIFELLTPNSMAKLFLAEYERKHIGGILILTYKGIVYGFYGGAYKEYLQSRPFDLLIWYTIIWGSENGYKRYDFLGAGKPDEEYGVREFKKQFGGQLVNFGRYKKIHSPKKLWLAEKGFEVWRKLKL